MKYAHAYGAYEVCSDLLSYSISRRNHYNAWLSQGRVPGEVLLRYGPEPGNNILTQDNNFNTNKRPNIDGFERPNK